MDSYLYFIIALLPLTAFMVVFQKNTYHAIILRGILGAIAALTYAVLGAPDVALTEALVGTMLAVTLYAIAVRSSLVLRLGILEKEGDLGQLQADLQAAIAKHQLRLELVPFGDADTLAQAFEEREIHGTCVRSPHSTFPYQTLVNVPRLYEIMKTELSSTQTSLNYINASQSNLEVKKG